MIVDSHAHVDEVPALGWLDPASVLIELMDEAGVDRAVVMTYTEAPAVNPNALEYLAQQIAQYPDRLIGYVRVHPWYPQALDLVDPAFGEFGMRGVKLHPVGTCRIRPPRSRCALFAARRSTTPRCCSIAVTSRSPAEQMPLQCHEQVMRREAEHADDDGAQHHVVDLEPGPRIVDQVPKASIRGNELGGHDHEKAEQKGTLPLHSSSVRSGV